MDDREGGSGAGRGDPGVGRGDSGTGHRDSGADRPDPGASLLYGADGRPRATWRVAATLGVFVAAAALAGVALQRLPAPAVLGNLPMAFALLVAVGAALLFATRVLDRSLREYGLAPDRGWWLDCLGGVAIGFAAHATVTGLHLAAGWERVVDVVAYGPAASAPAFVVALIAVACFFLVTALWEEFVFRAVLLVDVAEGLAARLDSPRTALLAAWLAGALVFGALHYAQGVGRQLPLAFVVLQATLAGLYFGLAVLLTGRLALPIGLHAATNLWTASIVGGTEAVVAGYPALVRTERQVPAAFEPVGGLALVGTALTAALVLGWARLTRGRVGIDRSLLRTVAGQSRETGSVEREELGVGTGAE